MMTIKCFLVALIETAGTGLQVILHERFFKVSTNCLNIFFIFFIFCRVFFSKRMKILSRFSKMQGKFYKFLQVAGKFLQNFLCSVPEVSKLYQK